MKQDNYTSFSVVVGFFIGLTISILKFDAPELIILGTIICTIGVYLIATFCAALYMNFIDYNNIKLNAKKLDSTLEFYLKELDSREKETQDIRKYLKHSIQSLNEDEE